MGRALIAGPELPRLCAEGKFPCVRNCLGCNDGCATRTGVGLDTSLTALLDAEGIAYRPVGDCAHAGKVLEAVADALRAAYAL